MGPLARIQTLSAIIVNLILNLGYVILVFSLVRQISLTQLCLTLHGKLVAANFAKLKKQKLLRGALYRINTRNKKQRNSENYRKVTEFQN